MMFENDMDRETLLHELQVIADDWSNYTHAEFEIQKLEFAMEYDEEAGTKYEAREVEAIKETEYEARSKEQKAQREEAVQAVDRALEKVDLAQQQLLDFQKAELQRLHAPTAPTVPAMPAGTLPEELAKKKPWTLFRDVLCGPIALVSCILAVLLIEKPIGALFMVLGVGGGLFWLLGGVHIGRKTWLHWFRYREAWQTWEDHYAEAIPDSSIEDFFATCKEYDAQYIAFEAACEAKRTETMRTLQKMGNDLAEEITKLTPSLTPSYDFPKDESEAVKNVRAKYAGARAKLQEQLDAANKKLAEYENIVNQHTLLDPSHYHLAWRIQKCLKTGRADSLKEALNIAIVDDREEKAEDQRRLEAEQLLREQQENRRIELERQQEEREHRRKREEKAARQAAEQAEAQAKRDREAAEQAKAQARRDREAAEHERRMEAQARRQAAEQERHNRQMEWNAKH